MTEPNLPVLRNEPGWIGAFTRDQAAGAIPNGADVVKTGSEPEDSQKDGTRGIVLGSISHPDLQDGMIFYFVEWRTAPRLAVGVLATKIQALRTHWQGGLH